METRHFLMDQVPIAFAVCALCGTMLDAQTVLTVELDGSGGFSNIQHAIDAAQDGDVVSVGPGEYIVDAPINFNRLHNPADSTSPAVKNLTVKSVRGPWETIIRMAESPADERRGSVIIFENGESERSRFEGFSVTSGQKSDADIWWTSGGGGVLCRGGSSPFLVRCRIVQNGRFGWIPVLGGGVCIIGSSPSLIDCTIAGNVAGVGGGVGVVAGREDGDFGRSSVTLENCSIINNWATGVLGDGGGGGVRCLAASATLVNCRINGNKAGWNGGGLDGGGGLNCAVQADVTLINCEISGNDANEGAAAWCYNDSIMSIHNCTVSGNRSLGGNFQISSSIYAGLGAATRVFNSILWSEERDVLVYADDGHAPGSVEVMYSCLETETVWPGPGNINQNPIFISAGRYDWERYTDEDRPDFIVEPGDYRLQATSPCIDGGTAQGAPEFDLEYNRRPCGLGHDIGVYESCNDDSSRIVNIPDPGLLSAIRFALNQPTDDISVEDMRMLTDLDASFDLLDYKPRPIIRSLEGLEAARNLTSLDFGGGLGWGVTIIAVDDFSSLAPLSRLATLDLSQNLLTGMIVPEGLSNLTTLNLAANQLSSLSFLERLRALTTLDISENDLTDLTLPAGLTQLSVLNAQNNSLTNLNLPPGLTNLTTLHLERNHLINITLPEGLTGLTTLYLDGNSLRRLDLPEGFSNLTRLDLQWNNLLSLTLPMGLNKLTTLDLSGNPITYLAIPFTVDLPNLELSGFDKTNVTRYVPLTVTRVGHRIEIAWQVGALQTMDALGRFWEDVLGATSPYRVEMRGSQEFFRVRAQ